MKKFLPLALIVGSLFIGVRAQDGAGPTTKTWRPVALKDAFIGLSEVDVHDDVILAPEMRDGQRTDRFLVFNADGSLRKAIPTGAEVQAVEKNPLNDLVAVGHAGAISVFDMNTGKKVNELKNTSLPSLEMSLCCWNPEGTEIDYLLSTFVPVAAEGGEQAESESTVFTWNLAQKKVYRDMAEEFDGLRDWSPSSVSTYLVVDKNKVKVGHTKDRSKDFVITASPNSTHEVNAMWSADGTQIHTFAVEPDKEGAPNITIWDAATGNQVRELPVASGFISEVTRKVAGKNPGEEGTVVFDLTSGEKVGTLIGESRMLLEDESALLTQEGNRFMVWDLNTSNLVGSFEAPVAEVGTQAVEHGPAESSVIVTTGAPAQPDAEPQEAGVVLWSAP